MLPAGASGRADGVSWRFSVRADGDFRVTGEPDALARRRAGLLPGTWTWLNQEHGARIVGVDHPGDGAGAGADGAVTTVPGAVLAVHTADCLPVVLVGSAASGQPVLGVVHAGWRGLVAGVLPAAVEAMTDRGAVGIRAVIGPHVRARCYEFGPTELDLLVASCGEAARADSAWGTPAADLLGAAGAVLGRLGVPFTDAGGCSACEPDRYFSHRARGETHRHAAAAVIEARA